jgi:hypothetical protein
MAVGRGPQVSDVECLDCGQPLRDPLSKALHRGPVCRRRLRIARAGVALPLLPRAAFIAAAPGQTAPPLDAATDTVPAQGLPVDRPDPKAPHDYEADPADETRDWSGKPTAPCRWCQRPRKNSIHRRPRTPRTPRDPRRELYDAAGRERDRAVLGERDDEE